MWLGIDTASWAQLWSGVIGSFVASVIGGLVALWVVRLTNGQQRRGAEEARERAAIADFIGTVQALNVSFTREDSFRPRELSAQLGAAQVRLHMASSDVTRLADAVLHWPARLVNLATSFHLANKRGTDLPVDVSAIIRQTTSTVLFAMREWPGATPAERDAHIAVLDATTSKLGRAIEDIDEAFAAQDAEKEAKIRN